MLMLMWLGFWWAVVFGAVAYMIWRQHQPEWTAVSSGPSPGTRHTGALIQTLGAGPYRVQLTSRTAAGVGNAGTKSWKAPAAAREACVMSFSIKFDPGFDFGCQGKVGGVAIGPGDSSGCRHTNDGASHRLMWRPGNGGQSYVYVPPSTYSKQPSPLNLSGRYACGMGMFIPELRGVFKTGVWHRVEIITKLNAPGKRDGVLAMSIDGKMTQLKGVTWRTSPAMQITDLSFNFFWGGGCVGRNSSLTYKDVAVYRYVD